MNWTVKICVLSTLALSVELIGGYVAYRMFKHAQRGPAAAPLVPVTLFEFDSFIGAVTVVRVEADGLTDTGTFATLEELQRPGVAMGLVKSLKHGLTIVSH